MKERPAAWGKQGNNKQNWFFIDHSHINRQHRAIFLSYFFFFFSAFHSSLQKTKLMQFSFFFFFYWSIREFHLAEMFIVIFAVAWKITFYMSAD